MVRFEKGSFSVTIDGCKSTYVDTIKALLVAMKAGDRNLLNESDIHLICNLIDSMLPDEEQIIDLQDIELLKQLKTKPKTK